MSATHIDTLIPVLEKIVRLEASTEPKHRAQLEKLNGSLPSEGAVPLMWSLRRIAEYNVRRARLEKALENNRAAVKEAIAAEEVRIAANAWKYSAGRAAPKADDAPDVKKGRDLIASLETQLKELAVGNRVMAAMIEEVAVGERDLHAIRDWRLYGGNVPSCVDRMITEKMEAMEADGYLETLPAWDPSRKREVPPVDRDAWIDDWNLPVPEWVEEVVPVAEVPPPMPVAPLEPVKEKRDYRRSPGEERKAYAVRMLFSKATAC
jgi:hypothetical protein